MPNRRHRKPLQQQQQQQLQQQQLKQQLAQQQEQQQPLPMPVRAQTPPLAVRDEEAAPFSPAGGELIETFCPQPRRFFPTDLLQQSNVASSGQQSIEQQSSPGSPWSRGVDEASDELRELLGGGRGSQDKFNLETAAGQSSCADSAAPLARPLSSVSTSAGPTPGPDERAISPTSWLIPDRYSTPTLEENEYPHDKPGSLSAQSQNRKVFVGGIPQDMNQDDLYTIFSEFAGVKKAWLQRYRQNVPGEGGGGGGNPPHNHRGFGFVIFYEPTAVDELLGNNFSRFITIRDGARLEVKRAVSSSDLASVSPSTHVTSTPQQPSQRSRAQAASSPATPALPPWPQQQQPQQPQQQQPHQLQQPQRTSTPTPVLLAPMPPWVAGRGGAGFQGMVPQGLTAANPGLQAVPVPGQMAAQPAAVMAALQMAAAPGHALGMAAPGGVVAQVVGGAMAPHAGIQLALAGSPQQMAALTASPPPAMQQMQAAQAQWLQQNGAATSVPPWPLGGTEAQTSIPTATQSASSQQRPVTPVPLMPDPAFGGPWRTESDKQKMEFMLKQAMPDHYDD